MPQQNLKNHTQIVWSYYIYTGIPILILIGAGIHHLIKGKHHFALIILLVGWILLSMLFRSRSFALKAQDRAIRAEENLRHFVLTGKLFDKRLTIGQIIALRFASDEELPSLAERAAGENLSNKQIKEAIRNWRADTYRV
ncbi:MAG: hypothetical protein C4329_03470 [Chitinophagaceae bacterium]